jgi:hydroxymethylpyrimidine/phosphomethylpyrimidine kinase
MDAGMNSIPTAMTIAGSDSSGGAGIQADLKTFAALGVYGTSAITAITSQNTVAVTDVLEMPTSLIASQIDAIMTDIGADVAKTGMLSSSTIIETVVQKIKEHGISQLVVDPVMVAKGGDKLLQDEAVDALRTLLIPLSTIITPNIPEAEALLGRKIVNLDDARKAARDLARMGAKSVVVKGGHLDGPPTDVFYDGENFREFTSLRIDTKNTHGTGCTFASAIAAGLAKKLPLVDAVEKAKSYVYSAIKREITIGQGHGPLNHFYRLWELDEDDAGIG